MLEKFSYVFIVGAGGSKPYNFPLGQGLYNQIRDNFSKLANHYVENTNSILLANETDIYSESEKFCSQLKLTYGISIDKYLNINPKFLEIGIKGISSAIYHSETLSKLPLNVNLQKLSDKIS